MPNYEFLGPYESDAGLPDGSVVHVKPRDVISYDGTGEVDGSAFWAATHLEPTVTDLAPPAVAEAAPAEAPTNLEPTPPPAGTPTATPTAAAPDLAPPADAPAPDAPAPTPAS
jgi:hypothetical protein